jgi:golgi-specific brefeldin A-resistance guanine nucleotide exchange factor 1
MESMIFNGLNIIRGEIYSMLTLIRGSSRWSAKIVRTTSSVKLSSSDKVIPSNPFLQGNAIDDVPIAQSLLVLIRYMDGIFDLTDIDMDLYISPFHDIIVSDQANGPLTCAALASLVKFASYGFFSSQFPRAQEGIAMIADCITRCIFEATDWESDELILMKLLELSTLTYKCDACRLLSVQGALDIYNTCISLQAHYQAKIMQFEAEVALRHLTVAAFGRAHLSSSNNNDDMMKMSTTEYDNLSPKTLKELESTGKAYLVRDPEGIPLLLGKITSILNNLIDTQSQSAAGVIFALTLINLSIEAGGQALSKIPVQVEILRDDIVRHLLKASQLENLEIFSLVLRVAFNLFMAIKDHAKVQLEVFVTSVHLKILSTEKKGSYSPAKEELAMESLLEFCREPSLLQDIYTNYDCDVNCTNLFDAVITTLTRRVLPERLKLTSVGNRFLLENDAKLSYADIKVDSIFKRAFASTTAVNRLALDGLTNILHVISSRCTAFGHELKVDDKEDQQSIKAAADDEDVEDEDVFSQSRDHHDIFYLARIKTAEVGMAHLI